MGTQLPDDAEFGAATSIGEAVLRFFAFAIVLVLHVTSFAQTFKKKTFASSELVDKIKFQYSTSDGGFTLNCQHYSNLKTETDYDVYCGKGTPWFKEYLVHLVVRQSSKPSETTYEILYWLTDRNEAKASVYSSTSQLITVDGKTNLKRFSLSQSLENDAAQLYLSFKD